MSNSLSVVQKVVHPLSRGLGRLRIDMSTRNTGVWQYVAQLAFQSHLCPRLS